MDSLEKITLFYKGRKKLLDRTNHNSQPSLARRALYVEKYYKYKSQKIHKFKSNDHLFCVKFNSSLPANPLKMETISLKRKSQMKTFQAKKASRKELEKILKWGIFYNKQNNRFTVPCGGALYHYEIYLCLLRSYLLPLGLYRYNPQSYTLGLIKKGNYMEKAVDVMACYLDRLRTSTGIMLFTSNLSESMRKYDYRSERLILLDIGHLMHSMNLSLTACGYGVSNMGGGLDKSILQFLGENKRSNYIASLFFGGLKDET